MTPSAHTGAQAKDTQQKVTLDEALELAKGHHQAGNLVLAQRTYYDILNAFPEHFPTTQFLGALMFQCGNYAESRRLFDLAVKAEPNNIACLNNYGALLLQTKSYDEALEYFDRALAIDPEYVDALNNKSYGLWQMDRYKEAEAVCRKTLKISHQDTTALNVLGMALARQYRYEEACDNWEMATKYAPERTILWSNWGNALRDMGRLIAAEEKCKKALEIEPNDPEAMNNMANVLRDKGEIKEALELYKKATDKKPDFALAHANLSIALNDDERYEEAAVAARYAIAFKPDLWQAYGPLTNALSEMAEFSDAHIAAQRGIQFAPIKEADPYLDLADVLSRLDLFDDAEAALAEALKRQPESARAYQKLSEIRERLGKIEEAHAAIDRAIELSPDMAKLWARKSMIYFLQNKMEEAFYNVDKAISLAPNLPVVLHNKVEMLIATNQNEEAEKLIRQVLASTKEIPWTYITLPSIKKFTSEGDPDLTDMLLLQDKIKKYGKDSESNYYYALSEIYDQIGKYDKAFEYLKKANDIQVKLHPGQKELDQARFSMGKRRERFSSGLLKTYEGAGSQSDLPVFICGMPRSGTTLTEQIISCHPDVFGAGELPLIGKINTYYPGIPREEITKMGEEYIKLLKEYDKTGKAKRITDKMPGNAAHIGFILMALPNAKIIYCRRNAIDNCLSCYQQNFAHGHYWSYDLELLGQYYNEHEAMIQFWREQFPGRFLEIDYEETVNNFEAQARKLIDYIGLEWNDACLEPHKQKRAVLTASRAQVTQPIYKTSVEKWRRYEKGLQPLIRILAPDLALPEEKAKS